MTRREPSVHFYGFYLVSSDSVFLDQEGNQCPLIEGSYSPCQMKIDGNYPDWKKCLFNNDANKEGIGLVENLN